jgi:hypothetical protein
MDDGDMNILKRSFLFKEWSDQTFKTFVDDNRIFLKKFRQNIVFIFATSNF